MDFDIKKTLDDMANAIAGVVTNEWPKVDVCIKKALDEEKDALDEIAQARLVNEINDDEMKSELDDETETLQAVLLACKVKAIVMAQQAANAAIKVLTDAINAALKAL